MASWQSVNGATGYRLDVSTSNAFSSYLNGYHDLDVGNVTGQVVTGLSQGTTYYYRVRAYDATGTGGYSNVMTATTARGTNLEKSRTSTVKSVSELAGRALLSVLFLLSGVGKLGAGAPSVANSTSGPVPIRYSGLWRSLRIRARPSVSERSPWGVRCDASTLPAAPSARAPVGSSSAIFLYCRAELTRAAFSSSATPS